MVEKNGKFFCCAITICRQLRLLHYLLKRMAVCVGSVIPAYYCDIANLSHAVTKKGYACLMVKLLRKWFSTIILVVAKASVHRSLQPMELLSSYLYFIS